MEKEIQEEETEKRSAEKGKVVQTPLAIRYLFSRTIYLSRPILHASSFIPSTPFAICFFNGLLLATNDRLIAISIYMRVRSIQSAYQLHYIMPSFCPPSSDNWRLSSPYPSTCILSERFSLVRWRGKIYFMKK